LKGEKTLREEKEEEGMMSWEGERLGD